MATNKHPPIKDAAAFVATVSSFCEELVVNGIKDDTMPLQQLRLLLAIYQHGTLNQNDLPRYTGVAKSANGRHIRRLGGGDVVRGVTGLGYIEYHRPPDNQRIQVLRITNLGKQAVEAAVKRTTNFLSNGT